MCNRQHLKNTPKDYRSERTWVYADSQASLEGNAIIQGREHVKNNCDGVRMINTHKPPENATVKRYGKPQKHYSK